MEDSAAPVLLPAREIVDQTALRDEIAALHAKGEPGPAFRTGVSKILRAAHGEGLARIRQKFLASDYAGLRASRSVADLTDIILVTAIEAAQFLHPLSNPEDARHLSTVAVGGYGRSAMAPFSDVDLLFVMPTKPPPWAESVVETVLYILWDMRLKVGHAVRDADSCIQLGRDDMTIRTTLLEMRLIHGDAGQLTDLARRVEKDLFRESGREFVDAKLEERNARHEAAGGSRYLLNPDIKNGKGGLRDLQTLYWLAKCMHGSVPLAELVRLGIFEAHEAVGLVQTERDLWSYRFHLHYAANRAEERLHFEHQSKIAEALGYQEKAGLKPVEHFMRDYYRTAKEVGDLTRIFCAALEARQEKRPPMVDRFLARFRESGQASTIVDGFLLQGGRLRFEDPESIERDPVQILRLFWVSQKHGAHIHPDAYRVIVQSFFYINEAARNDPEANRIFLDILTADKNPVRILRRMSETGVLGQFLPEFGHVIGLMQFDTFHHYTVDEHTLLALDTLSRIDLGELDDAHPLAASVTRGKLKQRRALYLALLLHDIGKGLGGDHSEKGAEIVGKLCPRLGLSDEETETVVWLVRHHLAMSNTAQRRDLSDPATARDFAALVQERERLNMLLVLTVCDMKSVSPEYWNDWKAQLLRDLHRETLRVLTSGQDAHSTDAPVLEAQTELRKRFGNRVEDARFDGFVKANGPPFWLGLDADSHETLAQMALDGDGVRLEHDHTRFATRASIYAPYTPELLTRLTAAFAATGASVTELRTYTSEDSMAASVFWIQSERGEPYAEETDLERIREPLQTAAAGKMPPAPPKHRRPHRPSVTGAEIPVRVRLSNDASDLYTLVEVTMQDRPGLLADLTRAITDTNTRIASIIATTYGERAVDSFYIKDSFGLKLSSDSAARAVEERLRKVAETTPAPAG